MDSHKKMRVKLAAVRPATVCCTLVLLCLLVSASDVQITAEPGQTVTLPCKALSNSPVIAVEWSRPDLEPDYVLLYRDKQSDPENQHPSFQNRVKLKDKQRKDRDVSLIFKNVMIEDTGTYVCRVVQRGTNRRKRSFLETDPICIIHLTVRDSSGAAAHTEDGGNQHGDVGLAVILSMFVVVVVVVVVGFVMCRKRKGVKEQNSYTAPGEKDTDHQQV